LNRYLRYCQQKTSKNQGGTVKISLSEAFTFLLGAKQRNFYARVLSALTRVEKRGLGTVAVGINNDGKYILYYDPDFLERLHFQELVLTLEHEVYHLILGHIPRYLDIISGLVLEEEKRKFKSAMNISADCATNELMRNEPKFDETYGVWCYGSEATEGREFIIPDTFGMKKLQPFEIYLFQMIAKMKKTTKEFLEGCKAEVYSVPMPGAGKGKGEGQGKGQQQDPQDGQGQGQGQQDQTPEAIVGTYFDGKTGGSHQFWEQGLGEKHTNPEEMQGLADKLRQEGQNIIRSAVQEQIKSRGTLPAGMREFIERMLAQPSIPWPRLLRTICTRTQQSKRQRGMRRPSRRLYGVPGILPFPGQTRDFKFTIAFAVDTSGSMSTNDLTLALRELLNIVKTETDVSLMVMYCDAALHVTYKVTKEEDVDFTIKGRGGTDFNPPFIKARELLKTDNAPDILIYATDGYAPEPDPENRVPIPVVWLITPTGTEPSPDYGIHIRMEPF
jgi:predicted metal-dependent peptidase